jgi:hypothetical protein
VSEASELLFLHAVGEEEESGGFIGLFFLPAHGDTGFHIEGGANVELEFSVDSTDELDGLGGTLLEVLDSGFLAVLLEVADGSLEVSLDVGHEVLLGELNFLEVEGVEDVVDHLDIVVVFGLISVECSFLVDDDVVILGDVLGLDLVH